MAILMTRYLFSIKVYHVAPITWKTDKVFELEFFVCYSWIVFLVNAHISGINDTTRFLENTLESMRAVSFRYLRIDSSEKNDDDMGIWIIHGQKRNFFCATVESVHLYRQIFFLI